MKFKVVHVGKELKVLYFIKAIRFFSGAGVKEAKDICDNIRHFNYDNFELTVDPTYVNSDAGSLYNNVGAFIKECASHGVVLTIDNCLRDNLIESASIAITEGRLIMARDLLNMAIDLNT